MGQGVLWLGKESGWSGSGSYQRCRPGLGRGSAQQAAHCQKACGQITVS